MFSFPFIPGLTGQWTGKTASTTGRLKNQGILRMHKMQVVCFFQLMLGFIGYWVLVNLAGLGYRNYRSHAGIRQRKK